MAGQGYKGDITSAEAWRVLNDDPTAILVDVRTEAEWQFVGKPDLRELGRSALFVEWQSYPDLALNGNFARRIAEAGLAKDATILLICRSGARSRNAAIALTSHGFERCFNVSDGFEGPMDSDGHRGTLAGWKVAGLPWRQG